MRDADLTTGVNIVLGAADGEIVPDPEVQKAALNVLVNCVCAPVHRAGTSTTRFSITGSSKKKTALKSYEDLIQKVWESVRTNNGIMVLLSLMLVKAPITDADRLRGLACRALAGLARCPTVRQIISKLPLFTTSQIQSLMRDPILQEKRQEHVMFQKYALELLERVSGKSKHMGAEFETSLANIHRLTYNSCKRCIPNMFRYALRALHSAITAEKFVPLWTATLMRDPILQEKRQEHVMFQKYALELLERVSGKSKHMGAEFETSLANIHRANVVAQTRINYNERQLLQLVAAHLAARGLRESAAALQREARLPPPATAAPAPPPPPVYTPSTPVRPRLSVSRSSSVGSAAGALLHRDSLDHNHMHVDSDSPLPPVIKLRKVQNSPACQPSEHKRSLQKQLSAAGERALSPPRVTLHSIITEYLYNQHALCKNPVVTCPQFNLFEPHKCPEPARVSTLAALAARGAEAANVCARVVRRELGAPALKRAHSRLVHAHFAPVRTLRLQDDDAFFTHTIFHPTQQQLLAATSSGDIRIFNLFTGVEENSYQVHESYIYHMQPTQQQLLAATSSGDIRIFNLFTGVEENSYQVHESYIYHMQASRDGLLLLASATTTWRPLSALWNMKEFEQLFQLDNEEYVEFSKMSDERIIGTKGETATVFDTRTGRELMTLAPAISNQYAKNRATFNPTDELVLSDGVLWDVNTGKEIHKFDKLNQTHSGVFHPNGLEVIFNPTCSALYAVCSDQDSEERSQFDTSFKTLDPYDYSSIATIDVKRNIYSLGVSRYGTQISLVENMGDFEQVQESCVKLYDVGRKRDHDDDAAAENNMSDSEGDLDIIEFDLD
ncbi:DDB1- and CUL4-associated factor-like 1 [Papilio machaon]|uniref:DDB1-and CUL4-associated factor-like 1 n=1 Tax=Papilio machaon TaxID=76193 RepID=A0A0N1IGQ8_PAPMA|nr:DDB1- and CUL4-associated factor-like 1 [Papilio machaon]